jgi:hypothetical protein
VRLPVRLPVLPRREPCLCRGGRRGGPGGAGVGLRLPYFTPHHSCGVSLSVSRVCSIAYATRSAFSF